MNVKKGDSVYFIYGLSLLFNEHYPKQGFTFDTVKDANEYRFTTESRTKLSEPVFRAFNNVYRQKDYKPEALAKPIFVLSDESSKKELISHISSIYYKMLLKANEDTEKEIAYKEKQVEKLLEEIEQLKAVGRMQSRGEIPLKKFLNNIKEQIIEEIERRSNNP